MTRPAPGGLVRWLVSTPSPVLTWYATDGERLELSGPTLARWVAKTAHLLLDLDVEPGERVLVDLGPAWRAPAFWLATWHVGATVVLPAGGGADIAAVSDGAPLPGTVAADRAIVVARPALALRAAAVPPQAVDYAATITGFPDSPPPAAPLPDPALVDGGGHVPASALLAPGDGRRLWLGPDAGPREIVGTWAAGGSVVWHDGLTGGAADRARLAERGDLPAVR